MGGASGSNLVHPEKGGRCDGGLMLDISQGGWWSGGRRHGYDDGSLQKRLVVLDRGSRVPVSSVSGQRADSLDTLEPGPYTPRWRVPLPHEMGLGRLASHPTPCATPGDHLVRAIDHRSERPIAGARMRGDRGSSWCTQPLGWHAWGGWWGEVWRIAPGGRRNPWRPQVGLDQSPGRRVGSGGGDRSDRGASWRTVARRQLGVEEAALHGKAGA